MPAPGGAAETQYDQNIRAGLPSPFPGLSARGFLHPRFRCAALCSVAKLAAPASRCRL